jgi:surface protein
MFYWCSGLTSLDVTNFDTSKVTDMSCMFAGCESLTSLDVTKFDTSKVTNMGGMFFGCESLASLDLSNFDTSKVTDMGSMFNSCADLTNIYVSGRWNTDKVTSSESMFEDCLNLPNYYSSSSTDKTHANYGTDGYLTYKATPTAKANTSNTSFASRLVSMILSRLAVPVHAADSASYVSADEKHCKITKDGNTWTYEFSVADDSAKYYAYEESVEGYISSNDVNSYGVVTKDEPLTITNTANELPKEPKPASLSLSKTADGKQLTDRPAEKYSHTSNIDDTGKANKMYDDDLNPKGNVVTVPGASKLHVKLYYSTESPDYDWVCVWAGSHLDYTAYENYSSSKLGTISGKIGGGGATSMSGANVIEGDIDGDTVTFGFRSDGGIGYYGYYAVVTGKDADGNAIKILSDTDIADIPSAYSNMAYMFDITLKNSDS